MPVTRDDIKSYLESTLGMQARLQRASGLKVPFHIKDAYQLLYLSVHPGKNPEHRALSMLLLVSPDDHYPGLVTLGKHIAQVQKASEHAVVYVCQSLSAAQRRSLISQQINFIQPGYQLFIPELAMDLREVVRTRRSSQAVSALLPAAQAMLLGCLYSGWRSDDRYTASAIMGALNYSRVTLSKVIDQLLTLDIIDPAPGRSGTNAYWFKAAESATFHRTRHAMRSPVRQRITIDRKLIARDGVFLAGESALAEYSMLAEPVQPVYGMTKKQFDVMAKEHAFTVTDCVDETQALVEIWAYPSLKVAQGIADEASLLLSLQDNPDERVQIALDDLKEKVTWLESGD